MYGAMEYRNVHDTIMVRSKKLIHNSKFVNNGRKEATTTISIHGFSSDALLLPDTTPEGLVKAEQAPQLYKYTPF